MCKYQLISWKIELFGLNLFEEMLTIFNRNAVHYCWRNINIIKIFNNSIWIIFIVLFQYFTNLNQNKCNLIQMLLKSTYTN